jgi:hypothetical protein
MMRIITIWFDKVKDGTVTSASGTLHLLSMIPATLIFTACRIMDVPVGRALIGTVSPSRVVQHSLMTHRVSLALFPVAAVLLDLAPCL